MNLSVSVVMPTRNAGKTVKAALDSVIGQSHQNWELLVFDACSTDQTVSIIQSFAVNDSRIHVLSRPDAGIYDAMNAGLDTSCCDYIFLMGAGDKLTSESVFANILEGAESGDVHLISGFIVYDRIDGLYSATYGPCRLLYENIPYQAAFYHRKWSGDQRFDL